MYKTILFDLDGTMLPMEQEEFVKLYFKALCGRFCPILKIDPDTLVKAVWTGTKEMVAGGDGVSTCKQRFWGSFAKICGNTVLEYEKDFDDFYTKEFAAAKAAIHPNPKIPALIEQLHQNGVALIAATNPIFPGVAQAERIKWAGIDPKVFNYITSYENSKFAKPDPRYYEEIIENQGLNPAECLMVGNDAAEDLAALKCNFNAFLVTDFVIDRGIDYSKIPNGNFDDLKEFLFD
jgi:FMN phosphatase YigB (HAD superfamily)